MKKHLPFISCWLLQWPLLGYCLWQAVMHARQWSWLEIGMRALSLWWLCYLGLFLGMQQYRHQRTGDAWFAVLTSPLVVWALWG
ncbi:MAG: hypothetical protein Q4D61_07460 [Cardiobacteriaceae bacterium]|nr:hypothetical protein [Cardiobacteriaceae bacterium]